MCSIRLHIRVIWHISTLFGLAVSKICMSSQRLYARKLPSKNNIVAQKLWRGEKFEERINRGLQRESRGFCAGFARAQLPRKTRAKPA